MAKYRKRVVEVEAVRYDGANHDDVARFVGGLHADIEPRARALCIRRRPESLWALPGDWVVCKADGSYSVCLDCEFKAAYEPHKED